MKKIKVLYFLSADHDYGAPRSFMEMIKSLVDNYDIEPIVVTCTYGKVNIFCKENNIKNYVIPYREYMLSVSGFGIKNIIKRILIPYFCILYRIKNFFALKKITKLININEVNIIHTNLNRVDVGEIIAKKYNKVHCWHFREFGEEDYNCVFLKFNSIKKINESSSSIIAISNAVRNSWIAKGIMPNKISTIYNGVNTSKILHSTNDLKKAKFKIIFSGSISENKGQIQLIKAVAKLSHKDRQKLSVDIYGSGNEKYIAELKKYVFDNNLNNTITFKGYCNDLYNLYSKYDIGVISSKSEGFGRVTVEYMSAALCVIATDTGANMEIIDNKKTGLIYEYNNIDMLSKILEDIINKKIEIDKIRKNAERVAKNNFDISTNAKNVYKLYCDRLENVK